MTTPVMPYSKSNWWPDLRLAESTYTLYTIVIYDDILVGGGLGAEQLPHEPLRHLVGGGGW